MTCKACNDDGVLHTHEGEKIGPCPDCSPSLIEPPAGDSGILHSLPPEQRDAYAQLEKSLIEPIGSTPTTVRRVPQEDAMGCGIACLAMVSGRSYAEVKATLPETFAFASGLTDHTVLWWLNQNRFWNRRSHHDDAPHGDVMPPRGLALALTTDRHFIVFDNGAVIDPARETPLPTYNIRQVIEVFVGGGAGGEPSTDTPDELMAKLRLMHGNLGAILSCEQLTVLMDRLIAAEHDVEMLTAENQRHEFRNAQYREELDRLRLLLAEGYALVAEGAEEAALLKAKCSRLDTEKQALTSGKVWCGRDHWWHGAIGPTAGGPFPDAQSALNAYLSTTNPNATSSRLGVESDPRNAQSGNDLSAAYLGEKPNGRETMQGPEGIEPPTSRVSQPPPTELA